MFALCLLAVLPSAPPEEVWWPRLANGQELVYRGSVTEEADTSSVQIRQPYQIETTLFVLGTPPTGYDLAVCTILKVPPASGTGPANVGSVRLEAARLGLDGRLSTSAGPWRVPLDGPPTLEASVFVAPPNGRLAVGMEWDEMESGRAPWSWRVEGAEQHQGRPCWKLVGEQKSDFWDRPGQSGANPGELAGWRRRDTLWLSTQFHVAVAVERTVERRLAGPRLDGPRLTVRYELQTDATLPGQLAADRRLEVQRALGFAEQLESTPREADSAWEALRRRIEQHLESALPTPYRPAILAIRDRVEAFRKGEDRPVRVPARLPLAALSTGRPVPDFVTENLVDSQLWRLGKMRGKPVLLVFYDPSAANATEVLRSVKSVAELTAKTAITAVVPVRGERAAIARQHAEVGLQVPTLAPDMLPSIYKAATTPRWLIVDPAGDLRDGAVGWTPEAWKKSLVIGH